MSKHRPRAAPPTPVRNVRTHEPGLATRRVITGTYRDRFHAWWKSTLATSCSGRRTHTMHRGGQHTHERIWSTPLTYRCTMNEDSARRAQATRRGTERTSSCTASSQLRLRASTAETRRGDDNNRRWKYHRCHKGCSKDAPDAVRDSCFRAQDAVGRLHGPQVTYRPCAHWRSAYTYWP